MKSIQEDTSGAEVTWHSPGEKQGRKVNESKTDAQLVVAYLEGFELENEETFESVGVFKAIYVETRHFWFFDVREEKLHKGYLDDEKVERIRHNKQYRAVLAVRESVTRGTGKPKTEINMLSLDLVDSD